jgi:hypothetical protein
LEKICLHNHPSLPICPLLDLPLLPPSIKPSTFFPNLPRILFHKITPQKRARLKDTTSPWFLFSSCFFSVNSEKPFTKKIENHQKKSPIPTYRSFNKPKNPKKSKPQSYLPLSIRFSSEDPSTTTSPSHRESISSSQERIPSRLYRQLRSLSTVDRPPLRTVVSRPLRRAPLHFKPFEESVRRRPSN